MKLYLTILLAALSLSFLGTANATLFGGDTTNVNPTANAGAAASSNSTAVSGSVSGASASNKSTLNNRSNVSSNNQSGASVNVEGDDYRAAATAFAPALTTGICMGSVSAAVGGEFFSIGGGKTVVDKECQIRYNSIRLEQLGMNDAGVVIMCQIESSRLALEQTGYTCPAVEFKNGNDSRGSMKPVWDNN